MSILEELLICLDSSPERQKGYILLELLLRILGSSPADWEGHDIVEELYDMAEELQECLQSSPERQKGYELSKDLYRILDSSPGAKKWVNAFRLKLKLRIRERANPYSSDPDAVTHVMQYPRPESDED